MSAQILTINGGSSSLKFALFSATPELQRGLSGVIERIGLPDGRLRFVDPGSGQPTAQQGDAADHAQAVVQLLELLDEQIGLHRLAAVGHRIVHGGDRYVASSRIDDNLVAELQRLSPLDPAHLPGEIAIIEALRRACPDVPEFACFDTAFHQNLPRVARLLPIPRRYAEAGVRKYGFHGLSYTFLLEELERIAGRHAAHGRVVMAHLGNGCSLAAVTDGRCVETTMGFTPTGGLVMGTRSGDLDPGVLIHLLRNEQLSVDEVDALVNRQSGLLGLSETSPDIRDLLQRESTDVRAAEAISVFCHRAKLGIGACVAALGGIDTLVFSAGIGENSSAVRSRICAGLECFGVQLDPARNAANAATISLPGATVTVRVMKTDEERLIAREVRKLMPAGARA